MDKKMRWFITERNSAQQEIDKLVIHATMWINNNKNICTCTFIEMQKVYMYTFFKIKNLKICTLCNYYTDEDTEHSLSF